MHPARLARTFYSEAFEVNLQDNDIHIWLGPDTGLPTDAILREVLGHYLPAGHLQLARTANGKPYLMQQGADPLQFNLSHTLGRVACAVSRGICLGIDIENRQRAINVDEVAQRFFHPDEIQALGAITDVAQRRQLFFRLWTCKEAYIKAIGQTIAGVSLQQLGFDCSAATIRTLFALPAQQQWHFHNQACGECEITIARARHCAGTNSPQLTFFSFDRWENGPSGQGLQHCQRAADEAL